MSLFNADINIGVIQEATHNCLLVFHYNYVSMSVTVLYFQDINTYVANV